MPRARSEVVSFERRIESPQLAGFKFGAGPLPPLDASFGERSGLESIHETSAWAPLVTSPRFLLTATSSHRDFFSPRLLRGTTVSFITSRAVTALLAFATSRTVAAAGPAARSRGLAAGITAASRPVGPRWPIPCRGRCRPRLTLDPSAERAPEEQLELMPLAGRKRTGCTARQRTELDRPKPHAHKALDLEPNRLAEPTNLAVFSFADGDLEL